MSRHRFEVEGALHLDLDEPFWELDGNTDFPSVLRDLIDLVPKGSILYLKTAAPTGSYWDSSNHIGLNRKVWSRWGQCGHTLYSTTCPQRLRIFPDSLT